MELRKAIALLESYGLSPSLHSNGVAFLGQVADVIQCILDNQPDRAFTLKSSIPLSSLDDQHIFVIKSDDRYPDEVALAEVFKVLKTAAGGKHVPVIVLGSGVEVEISTLTVMIDKLQKLLSDLRQNS